MEIKTKFNVGDLLYTINDYKIVNGIVKEINIEIKNHIITVKYWIVKEDSSCCFANNDHSYLSRDELIRNL